MVIEQVLYNQVADQVKQQHLCDCPDRILQIALVANKYKTL